jgi:diguanylate cyclase (GGDEF)-like protein
MQFEKEQVLVEEFSKLILDIMMLSEPPPVPDCFASVDSFQALCASLLSLREYLYSISNGDMGKRIPLRGYIGGTLKSLQANLRHMTWQTKMVASGDFSQRIEFMGDFSESFNAMVVQLDQTLKELVKKKSELSRLNEELLEEIIIRKQTEAALRLSQEELKRLAITDSLTGLYNRRHFNKLAEDEIRRSIRYLRPLSVMLFDIDFFKRVNDTFGHSSGDRVLSMIGRTTQEMLRATEISARYGGEEFIVLFPETSSFEAAAVAERLRMKIEETAFLPGENVIAITASFGISDFPGKPHQTKSHESLLSELVSNADRAMYCSKKAGRNRITVFRSGE